jgi:hypothetical protein
MTRQMKPQTQRAGLRCTVHPLAPRSQRCDSSFASVNNNTHAHTHAPQIDPPGAIHRLRKNTRCSMPRPALTEQKGCLSADGGAGQKTIGPTCGVQDMTETAPCRTVCRCATAGSTCADDFARGPSRAARGMWPGRCALRGAGGGRGVAPARARLRPPAGESPARAAPPPPSREPPAGGCNPRLGIKTDFARRCVAPPRRPPAMNERYGSTTESPQKN